MERQVVLDTETTGIRTEDGHRIIEIGCIEIINRKITGREYHCYLNPSRTIEDAAFAVHGISNEFLRDKPAFSIIADELLDFIAGAEVIIHNASFDVSFINYELSLCQHACKSLADRCTILDTLSLARKMHVGQRNSLDALCKRYVVDNSKRELHGAILDAYLLAQVYLAMTGGQGSFFDVVGEVESHMSSTHVEATHLLETKEPLIVLKADQEEVAKHEEYLTLIKKQGRCVWLTG